MLGTAWGWVISALVVIGAALGTLGLLYLFRPWNAKSEGS